MATDSALDYARLAPHYDDYCVFDGDVACFVDWTRRYPGAETLELMAGTGRISLPLAEAGARLTSVDRSLAMLLVLRRKLRERGLRARLVCADARQLPLRGPFPLVLLPFQGLTEVTSEEGQLAVLREAAALLPAGGRFVCTTHNPPVRLRAVDDSWHELGTFPRASGGTVTVALRCRFDARTGNVVGQQRLVLRGPAGESAEVGSDLCFRLISLSRVRELCERAGLRVAELHGDYRGGRFDPVASPVIVLGLERGG